MLDIKTLSSLGIIVTELITNAMKYGFSGDHKGWIRVKLFRKNGKIYLFLSNNGISLPDEFSLERTSGFGLHLVSMMVKQLNGTLDIQSNDETLFKITFPTP